MANITLPRNVHFVYEHALAYLELTQAYNLDVIWDFADPWEVTANLNGQQEKILKRAAYVWKIQEQESVYSELIRPSYQGGRFNRTRSENQYLTHWIYPYKGKFHPQMIRAILNIIGAEPGWVVADFFSGSGTTLLECQLLGIDALGVEISPLCVLLTRVKTQAWKQLDEIERAVGDLDKAGINPVDVTPSDWGPRGVVDFIQIARMVTFSDVSRRRRDPERYFRRNLRNMLKSIKDMSSAIDTFGIEAGKVKVLGGDVRYLTNLGIESESVNAVITSPPYSIALDYVSNDEHSLEALGYDPKNMREDFIGVRGKGNKEKIAYYEADMRLSLSEIAKAIKPEGHAVLVVGNVTLQGKESVTIKEIVGWAEEAGLVFVKSMPKIVWGLYNLVKDEKILFFPKGGKIKWAS